MKLSGAQERAYDALKASPDGRITSGSGGNFKRTTMEALARMGLVTVHKEMREKTVKHRNGKVTRRMVVDWAAQLKPVLPNGEEIAELDLIVERGEKQLRDSQREDAAAYVAVMAPRVALEGAPVKSPDYSASAAYVEHLRLETPRLLAAYMVVRHMTGEIQIPADPSGDIGEPTDTWLISEPGTPAAPGRELARVKGDSQNAAAYAANALLNRRGGYDMRRLGDKELGLWVRDFRAGTTVLRLEGDGAGAFRAREVASGLLVAVGATAAEAEREALAETVSLMAALPK